MDKSRQQFEDALKSGFNTKHLSLELQRENGCGTYRWGETERCWEMWQASRESLINNLEPEAVIYRYSNKTNFSFEKSKFDELIQQEFTPLYRLDK